MTPLREQLHRMAEFDGPEARIKAGEWTLKEYGDSMSHQSELDANFRGRADENARLQPLIQRLIRVAEAAERLEQHHRDWINGARADVIYERMAKEFDALAALKSLGEE